MKTYDDLPRFSIVVTFTCEVVINGRLPFRPCFFSRTSGKTILWSIVHSEHPVICSDVRKNKDERGFNKGEKADSVYPGYGRDPEDPEDPEDTTAIQRIQRIRWRYGGYNDNPEDTSRARSIKRNRVMKIQSLQDRRIRLMTSHFL